MILNLTKIVKILNLRNKLMQPTLLYLMTDLFKIEKNKKIRQHIMYMSKFKDKSKKTSL